MNEGAIFGAGRRRARDPGRRKAVAGGGGNGGGGGLSDPPSAEFTTQWENDPVDTQLSTFADIDDLLSQNPSINQFLLQHDGKSSSVLNTKVDANGWLHFHYDVVDDSLARIEAKIEQDTGHEQAIKETRSTIWAHLNSDLDVLKGAGFGGNLMMFAEWKVRPQDTNSFRFMLRFIADDTHGLAWMAEARTTASDPDNEIFWQIRNRDVGVPLGTDFWMEVYYLAGDDTTGRLVVTIDLDDGAGPITVFDITDWTDRPNAGEIQGVQNWYPFLLYVANNTAAAQHLADNDVSIDYAVKWWAVDTGSP